MSLDPQAPLPSHVDVSIVGAGAVGCSIAYQLSKRGKHVAVFDRHGICSGASGRNGGLTGSGSALHSTGHEAVYALTAENFSMLQDHLARELNDGFALRVTGHVDIATNDEQAAFLRESVSRQREYGVDADWLDARDVQDLIPGISQDVLGAELTSQSGHLWPFQFVHALANGARYYRTTFHTHTNVERIETSNGRVAALHTDRGTVETESVVVATNAWTRDLLPDLPEGAVIPARGQILVTQPVGPILPMPFTTNFDKEYGRQTHSGQVISGGFRRLDRDEGLGHISEHVSAPALGGIARCLSTIFPRLKDLRVVRSWAGIMGFTADGLPMIGTYGANSGVYVAAGFNGGGLSWAAATGKAMAQLINNGRSTLDLEPFDPNRFTSTDPHWENPFTAGEKNNPRKLNATDPVS